MLNFCIFVFVFYELFAIVRMLFAYGIPGVTDRKRAERGRHRYEKDNTCVSISEKERAY